MFDTKLCISRRHSNLYPFFKVTTFMNKMKPLQLKMIGLIGATNLVLTTLFTEEMMINMVYSGQREEKVCLTDEPILLIIKGTY